MMTNAEAINVLLNEWKCIDRNDGIHCNRKCESCDLVMDSAVLKDAYNLAIKALEAQEWIPCKDRLPGQEQRVLINLSDGDTSVGWLLRGDIWFTDYSCGKPEDEVVAWMPLPEPYKEGE